MILFLPQSHFLSWICYHACALRQKPKINRAHDHSLYPSTPTKKTKENDIWTKPLNWTTSRTQRIRPVYMLIETPTSFRAFPLTLGTRLVKLTPPITNTCTPKKTAAGNVIYTDLQWGISLVLISHEKDLNSSMSTSSLILRLYLGLRYSSPPLRLPAGDL